MMMFPIMGIEVRVFMHFVERLLSLLFLTFRPDDAVLHAKGKIRESQQIPFSMAADVLHVDITAVEKVSKPIFSDKPAKILKEVREQISAAKQTIEKVFDPEEEERRKAIEKWENEINRVKEAARLSAEIEFEARLAKEREAILEAIARSQAQDAKKYNLESLGGDSNIVPARTSSPETNVQDISISLGRNSLGQNDTPTISDSRSRNGSSCTELPVASNASSSNNTPNSQSSISVTPSQAQPTLVSTTASVSLSKDSSSASIASTSTSATTSGNSSMNISSSNSTSTMSQPSSSVVSSDSSMGVVNDQTANQSSTYHHNQGVLVPTPRNRKKSTSEPVMEIGNASSENGDVDMPVQEVVDMKCKCAVM